jgi:hypothetical protein
MGSDSEDDENEFEGQSSDVEAEEEVDIEEDLLETIEQATSEASDHVRRMSICYTLPTYNVIPMNCCCYTGRLF